MARPGPPSGCHGPSALGRRALSTINVPGGPSCADPSTASALAVAPSPRGSYCPRRRRRQSEAGEQRRFSVFRPRGQGCRPGPTAPPRPGPRAQGQAGVQRRLRSTPHKARGRRWVSSRWRDSRQRGQFPAPCGLQIQRVSCETCPKSQRERSIPRSPLRLEFSFSKEHAFRQEIVRTVGTSS